MCENLLPINYEVAQNIKLFFVKRNLRIFYEVNAAFCGEDNVLADQYRGGFDFTAGADF